MFRIYHNYRTYKFHNPKYNKVKVFKVLELQRFKVHPVLYQLIITYKKLKKKKKKKTHKKNIIYGTIYLALSMLRILNQRKLIKCSWQTTMFLFNKKIIFRDIIQ
jgi:hypothetical protein